MTNNYLNIYNNLVNLTRNKNLYQNLSQNDTFSDRLTILLFHFCFFLKRFKDENSKEEMQKIHDFFFRQIELSVREIGYGDASINKKMKNYLNMFHSILEQINNWENISHSHKNKVITDFLNIDKNVYNLVDYFDKYIVNLSNNSLNFYIKGVVKDKF